MGIPEDALAELFDFVPVIREELFQKDMNVQGIPVSEQRVKMLATLKQACTGSPEAILTKIFRPDPLLRIRDDMFFNARKICALLGELKFSKDMTPEEMQRRFTEYLEKADPIFLAGKTEILNGNTRLILAKIFEIPDEKIWILSEGERITLAAYRKLMESSPLT